MEIENEDRELLKTLKLKLKSSVETEEYRIIRDKMNSVVIPYMDEAIEKIMSEYLSTLDFANISDIEKWTL